jgi:hypothetical protein
MRPIDPTQPVRKRTYWLFASAILLSLAWMWLMFHFSIRLAVWYARWHGWLA